MLELGSNFTAWDWAIVVVYLLGTVLIGFYANRYIEDVTDYIIAGRSLKSFLGIATMLGSEIGLVTVMYSAQKGFTGGFAAFHIGLVAGIGAVVVGLTGLFVVPLRRMGVVTIPEFYERRFGRGVRILGGAILAVTGILNMGLFLRAGAIFLTGLTGLADPNAVKIVMTVLIVVVLAYTISGGMVSVVITDYIQFVVLAIGLMTACIVAVSKLGWGNVVDAVSRVHGDAGFNPLHGEGYGIDYVLEMSLIAGLVSCAVWPTAVMRACAMESAGMVRRLYLWSSVGFMTRFIIPMFLGICAMTYLLQVPAARAVLLTGDGRLVGDPNLTLQAMPVFLSQVLPAGLIGLIGAGMLAAFMSTHDSYLLCWASVLVEDVCNPVLNGTMSPRQRITLVRVFIFLIGVFLLVWSLWYPLAQDMWDYLTATATFYAAGAIALLTCGLYWKGAGSTGAYLALICGSAAVLGLDPVRKLLHVTNEDLGFSVSKSMIVLGTVSLSMMAMIVGSLVSPDNPRRDLATAAMPEESQ